MARMVSASEYVALSDYQVNVGDKKVNVSGGKSYTVIEMAPNGWSLIKIGDEEGWVPSDLLNRRRKESVIFAEQEEIYQNVKNLSPIEDIENSKNEMNNNSPGLENDASEEHYVTIGAYDSSDESGISFKGNVDVVVIERNESGWWYIKIGNDEGWAPSTYLKPNEKQRGVKKIINNGSDTSSRKIDLSLGPPKPNRKSQIPQSYENVGIAGEGKEKPPVPKPRSASRTSSDESNTSSPVDELKAAFAKKRVSPNIMKCQSVDDKSITANVAPKPALQKISEPGKKPARPEKGPSPVNLKGKITPPVPNRPVTPNTRIAPSPKDKSPRASPSVPARPSPIKGELYATLCDYNDKDEGMLSFKAGEKVQVLEKDDGGWWLAMIGVKKGWVPSNFLKKL